MTGRIAPGYKVDFKSLRAQIAAEVLGALTDEKWWSFADLGDAKKLTSYFDSPRYKELVKEWQELTKNIIPAKKMAENSFIP